MTTFTYNGPEPSLAVGGVTFTRNVATTVSDEAVAKAVRDYQPGGHFTEGPTPQPDAEPRQAFEPLPPRKPAV